MKLQFSDFELLSDYINRNCRDSSLNIYVTANETLVVKSENNNGDDVEITCFNFNVSGQSFPQLTTKVRLTKDLK